LARCIATANSPSAAAGTAYLVLLERQMDIIGKLTAAATAGLETAHGTTPDTAPCRAEAYAAVVERELELMAVAMASKLRCCVHVSSRKSTCVVPGGQKLDRSTAGSSMPANLSGENALNNSLILNGSWSVISSSLGMGLSASRASAGPGR
jgi:hypothetical protein